MAYSRNKSRGVVSSAADDPIELILSIIPDAKSSGKSWLAKCPAHEDKNPSLGLSRGKDGRALMKCHAGCSTDAICDAIGISVADLFPKGNTRVEHPNTNRRSMITKDFDELALQYQRATDPDELEGFAHSLGLDAEALRRLGVGWDDEAWAFPMRGVDERIVGYRRRFPSGDKRSLFGGKDGLFIPSGLSMMNELFVCEGPSDTAALLMLGLDAIGRPSCTGGVELCCKYCGGRNVVIMADGDGPGRKGAKTLAQSLSSTCVSVRIIEPPVGIKDARAWLLAGCTASGVQALATKTEPLTQADAMPVCDDWGDPIPFGVQDVPAFPIEAIPEQLAGLRKFCEAAAESLQVPIDAVAMLVLAVGGASFAKRIAVKAGADWPPEPTNLFCVIAMPSGERKSSLFRLVTKPLSDSEREENERLAPLIERNRNERALLEAELKKARADAVGRGQADTRLAARNSSEGLTEQLRTLEVVVPLQLVADDATPEAVSRLLDEQGGRLALLSAEGDVFDLMSGRYSDGAARLGVYLKGHAGDDIRVNRVGRPSEFIKDPALTCGLAVQPSVLCGLMEKPQLRGRGLLARFLYCLPTSLVGYRRQEPDPISGATLAAFDRLIRDALKLQPSTDSENVPCPHIIRLGNEAQADFLRFRELVEHSLRDSGELAELKDWGSKLPGAVCRIAGVLHGFAHAPRGHHASELIDRDTMLGAIAIGEYFVEHAKAAFQLMGSDSATTLAKKLLRWMSNENLAEFSKHECHRANRTKKADELDEPLGMLVERGYIRQKIMNHSGPGRKPSPRFEINPRWLGSNGQNGPSSDTSGIMSNLSIVSTGGDS